MRILALDQASYKTGYALFDGIDLVGAFGCKKVRYHSRARRRYDGADKQFNCKDTSS